MVTRKDNRKFLVHLGDAIRERRRGLGLTQEDLAGETGFDRSYISDIERGEQNITTLSLWKLSTCLNIPISKLMRKAELASTTKNGR